MLTCMSVATRIALGNKIRALRHSNNLSQQTLALMTGIERSYLAKLESGKRNPGLDCLERISNGFGITLSELFDGTQEPRGDIGAKPGGVEQGGRPHIDYRHIDI